jgi:hypothetical protein
MLKASFSAYDPKRTSHYPVMLTSGIPIQDEL